MKFQRMLSLLKPHRTVPQVPWTARNRWDLSLKRVAILFFGLAIFGLGDGLIIQSGLGNAPWSVLAQGISLESGLSIGTCTLIIGALVLSLWIPLKERPGFGTLANILIISLFIEVATNIFPLQEGVAIGFIFTIVGIAMVGIGSALYITCGLGPGPRDGAMTGLHQRTGVRVGRVRLGLEVLVSIAGAALGGTLGLGTVLFALLIGQSVAISFGVLARLTSK
ncbi:MAG: YczE/YyaS/YitT family protein [Candidatus Planktophila sp.]